MGGNTSLGSGGSFGGAGQPGFISPFTSAAFNTAGTQGAQSMVNRYNQLGMPGSTPEAMDIGAAPSLTGGIPAEAQAAQGQLQTQDLGQTSSSANAALQSKNNQIGAIGQGAGLLGSIL
jgi:hypothetical protein